MLNTAPASNPWEVETRLLEEAASIRSRVGRASASSQAIMRAEAAAYERSAVMIRNMLSQPIGENA